MDEEYRTEKLELTHEKVVDAFARIYPYFAISGVVLVVVVSITIGVFELARRGFQTVGIPVIIGSVTLIVARHAKRRVGTHGHAGLGYGDSLFVRAARRKRVTVSAFLLLFAVSVWLLTATQTRPWTYFVVVTLTYAVLLVQISTGEADARVVLAEVSLLMLNQIYGVTLKYAYYYGWTDVFMHVGRAKLTHLTGHTVPTEVSVMYARFPLYHVFVSEASYLLDLNVKLSLFVVTAIPYVVTAILVYHLVSGAFEDDRIPALVTVLYSANTIVLFYGSYMITRTMAFVGFVFLLYVVYKRASRTDRDAAPFTVLLLLMTCFTTIVHQVTMPQIVILLLGLYACKRFVGLPRFLRLRTILLVTVIFLSYWVLFAWDFVMTLADIYARSEHYEEVNVMSVGSSSTEQRELAQLTSRIRYLLQNYVTVFYAIIGVGIGLYEDHTKYARTLLLFALLTLGLFVPSPLRVIGQAMELFRFDRLELLVSPFVATAMGVGVVALLRQVGRNRSRTTRRIGTALVAVLVVTYVFTSITHPLVASDSNDLPWSESRNHLTESEVEGFDFVLREVESGSIIRADAHTAKFFNRMAFDGHDRVYPEGYRTGLVPNVSNLSQYEGYTVFRGGAFRDDGLKLSGRVTLSASSAEARRVLNREFRQKDKVFSNGDVAVYYTDESNSGSNRSSSRRSQWWK